MDLPKVLMTTSTKIGKTLTVEKISLNSEGILLRCISPFQGKPKRVNSGDAKKTRVSYVVPEIKEDEVVLFLGCWHHKMQVGFGPSAAIMEREFKSPLWVTSLRFLSGPTIVKIDWVGIGKLDQLLEAAKFVYAHFRLVDR